ncbi:unnamed protein product, partial [Sphagnum jensenii]
MPSRQMLDVSTLPSSPEVALPLASSSPLFVDQRSRSHRTLILCLALGGGLCALLAILLMAVITYQRLRASKTSPCDANTSVKLRKFPYKVLKAATSEFSNVQKLGQGGFGSVYKGVLHDGTEIAVKKLDASSLQGEREFQNEVSLIGHVNSPHIVKLLGFCAEGKHRLLVYTFMANRSLQEVLFDEDCFDPLDWDKRFKIILDTAQGLTFLHVMCNPPIIHGDVKPSNILLDSSFRARIADFGLSRLKSELQAPASLNEEVVQESTEKELINIEHVAQGRAHHQHMREEAEIKKVEKDKVIAIINTSPQGLEQLPEPQQVAMSSSHVGLSLIADSGKLRAAAASGNKVHLLATKAKEKKGHRKSWSRDWWWKQERIGEVKRDYIFDWRLRENKRTSKSKDGSLKEHYDRSSKPMHEGSIGIEKQSKDCHRHRFSKSSEWLGNIIGELSKEDNKKVTRENLKGREWWREEYCDELSRKCKELKKRKLCKDANLKEIGVKSNEPIEGHGRNKSNGEASEEVSQSKRLKSRLEGGRHRSRSREWWSAEFFSRGVCSTPSMRGTICYVAPEYGGAGNLSEKIDVYSFGVLLLVIISGRRPLQVNASPFTDFERANLISWTRSLAQTGNPLDLVDPALQGIFSAYEASMCIIVALLCLQRLPATRPSMEEIVKILSGVADVPALPLELSPSPPGGLPFKSRQKPSTEI